MTNLLIPGDKLFIFDAVLRLSQYIIDSNRFVTLNLTLTKLNLNATSIQTVYLKRS